MQHCAEPTHDIKEELGAAASKEVSLQMAVKAVNDSSGPEGLVPYFTGFWRFPTHGSHQMTLLPQFLKELPQFERQWTKSPRSEPRCKSTMH